MLRHVALRGLGWLLLAASGSASAWAADEMLTIGSVAPEINVEHWVQNGEGKFKPVTQFADGKVYVVEFWATWCGPCIASMPHIAELQKNYADKGVQVISISDENLETVEKFLEGEVRGAAPSEGDAKDAKPQTYKMLTSGYCLTTDPDRSCHVSYMEAAGQNGIPTAFIVGKDKKIEWIGHPMRMDEPLEQIVADKWDRQKFGEEFKESQRFGILLAKMSKSMREGDFKSALAAADEAISSTKDPQMKKQLVVARVRIMMNDKDSQAQLPKLIGEAYTEYAEDASVIITIARSVIQQAETGAIKDEALFVATRKSVEALVASAEGARRGPLLDTLAHVQFLLGDLDGAIKTESEAIELAPPQVQAQLKEFVEKVQQAKAEKADPAK